MRKESGFNPHDLSYADAQGLLQMIPPTTLRVAKELRIPYDPGRLYEPAYNIQTGSWYIGHLLQKFKRQIPIGAGSFNCGPRPVMKWIDQHGDREIDELVELVPYTPDPRVHEEGDRELRALSSSSTRARSTSSRSPSTSTTWTTG